MPVHFYFPNDLDAGTGTTNHVAIDLSGFSRGLKAFKNQCEIPQESPSNLTPRRSVLAFWFRHEMWARPAQMVPTWMASRIKAAPRSLTASYGHLADLKRALAAAV